MPSLRSAQTSLRAVIGRADLGTLLSDCDHINAELKKVMAAAPGSRGDCA
ncbi:regulator of protease activity HflC (stomatin/prohibitin superfamily) [Streptomyces canus]|nr:hypothetical protein [Streptomyces canus]MDQ0596266.1 regulator of protease activity HflC (stomatin/prohibitin superfamily) [Streptomyces canus]